MQRGRVFKRDGRRGWIVQWWVPDATTTKGWRRQEKGGFKKRTDAFAWLAVELKYESATVTFGELRDRYLAVYPGAASTKKELRRRLGKAIDHEAWGEDFNPARLTPEEIEAWRLTISEGQRFYVTQALKQTLRWGFEKGHLPTNPGALVKNRMHVPDEKKPFESWEEIEAVAEELGAIDGVIPIFAAGTGLRPGEWRAVSRRRDLDLKADVPAVAVRRRRTKDGKTVNETKNGGARRVPLSPRVVEAIQSLPHRLDTDLLFPSAKGGYLDLHNFATRQWRPALDGAGLARRGLNMLRHTYATFLIAEGVDTFTISRVMGTSMKMIDDTYGHLLEGATVDVHAALIRSDGGYVAADGEATGS
jgi:integrase